jgi:aminoglycoside phosphotransferase (APT) family kinase protein
MGTGSGTAADALARQLSEALDAASIDHLERLSGGASRETWRFDADGESLVVQRQRPGDIRDMLVEAKVVRVAGSGGAPVPQLLHAGVGADGLAFMVLRAVDGETIARKIQRDERFAAARECLVSDLGEALARIHRLDRAEIPELEPVDPIEFYTEVLDDLGQPQPMLELVRRWLIAHRPAVVEPVVVHGDFRLGNVIVDESGLAAVIDWELARTGDPMEDLGWLCVKAWRFGQRQPVAGLGDYEELIASYESSGGRPVDRDALAWWEVVGTWKWAIMCMTQANAHRSAAVRSHELAAIGRRVCENEHDLFLALEGRW